KGSAKGCGGNQKAEACQCCSSHHVPISFGNGSGCARYYWNDASRRRPPSRSSASSLSSFRYFDVVDGSLSPLAVSSATTLSVDAMTLLATSVSMAASAHADDGSTKSPSSRANVCCQRIMSG